MGEAKKRGKYEMRIQQSIENAHMKKEKEREEAFKWWDSLTDEEREIEIEKERKRESSRGKAMRFLSVAMALNAYRR